MPASSPDQQLVPFWQQVASHDRISKKLRALASRMAARLESPAA